MGRCGPGSNEAILVHLRTTNDVKVDLPILARAVSAPLGADDASLIAPTSC